MTHDFDGKEDAVASAGLASLPRLVLIVRVVAIEILLIGLGMAYLTWDSLPEGSLDRDWVVFYRIGDLWWQGRLTEIYTGSLNTGMPVAYPPYTIYLFALYSLIPRPYALLALVVFSVLWLVASLVLLGTIRRGEPGDQVTIALVALASAPFLGTIIVGHWSAFLLLLVVAGAAAWQADRHMLAGGIWALLMMKPQLFLPLALLFLAARQWAVLRGMALVVLLLLLSAAPMGMEVWKVALEAISIIAEGVRGNTAIIWKQQTYYAFLTTALDGWFNQKTIDVFWIVTNFAVLLSLLDLWRRGVPASRRCRYVSTAVLFMVCGNSYLWFYDSLLLFFPAAIWYLARHEYSSNVSFRVAGVMLGLILVWQHVSLFWLKTGPTLTGLFLIVWLLAEIFDLRRLESSGSEQASGKDIDRRDLGHQSSSFS